MQHVYMLLTTCKHPDTASASPALYVHSCWYMFVHLQVAGGVGAPLLLLILAAARGLAPLPGRRHVRLGYHCRNDIMWYMTS